MGHNQLFLSRNRVCVDGDLGQTGCIGSLIETADCDPSILPVWSPWTAYSECTVTCGGGTQVRSRVHSCTGVVEEETQACNTDPGVYYEWSGWSECSTSCGQGTHTKIRGHSCLSDNQIEVGTCRNDVVAFDV